MINLQLLTQGGRAVIAPHLDKSQSKIQIFIKKLNYAPQDGLKKNITPYHTLSVLLPVNDVIERDWFSVGIEVNLLLKLISKIHHLYMMQQLVKEGQVKQGHLRQQFTTKNYMILNKCCPYFNLPA